MLAFDNSLRIFNAVQSTVRCSVVNDTGGPFTGMEHDPIRSQVTHRHPASIAEVWTDHCCTVIACIAKPW